MDYLYWTTDIPGIPQHATCDYLNSNQDGDPATDVAWAQFSDPVYGSAVCAVRTASDSSVCDQRLVSLNVTNIQNVNHWQHQMMKTTCHELGHTVGLDHYYPQAPIPDFPPGGVLDCMASQSVDDYDEPTGSWTYTYNSHHIAHINAWW
uniref:hypothetical protein n=1 Tax=Herbidospora sakaeratensis TaxID=564415 RepID=UPI0012F749F7|nr:hypothetical protein [Herbidospora sakaeratensis]